MTQASNTHTCTPPCLCVHTHSINTLKQLSNPTCRIKEKLNWNLWDAELLQCLHQIIMSLGKDMGVLVHRYQIQQKAVFQHTLAHSLPKKDTAISSQVDIVPPKQNKVKRKHLKCQFFIQPVPHGPLSLYDAGQNMRAPNQQSS